MSNAIRVREAWSLIAHDSFSGAVSASEGGRGAVHELDLINGKFAEAYKFYGDFLSVKFTNGKYLSIWPGPNRIDWKVSDEEWAPGGEVPAEGITLEFSNGERTAWHWKAVLDSFMGKQVAVSPSDQLLLFSIGEGWSMWSMP